MMPMGHNMSIRHPWLRVIIDDIEGNVASVIDSFGKRRHIRLDVRRGNGPRPRVGETWILDNSLGEWTFAAALTSDPPTITGSNNDIPALKNLLSALEEMGLIVDETTTA